MDIYDIGDFKDEIRKERRRCMLAVPETVKGKLISSIISGINEVVNFDFGEVLMRQLMTSKEKLVVCLWYLLPHLVNFGLSSGAMASGGYTKTFIIQTLV